MTAKTIFCDIYIYILYILYTYYIYYIYIYIYIYPRTSLDIKKYIAYLHTLSAYNRI